MHDKHHLQYANQQKSSKNKSKHPLAWLLQEKETKVSFLSGKAESSAFSSPVTTDLYELEQDGEVQEYVSSEDDQYLHVGVQPLFQTNHGTRENPEHQMQGLPFTKNVHITLQDEHVSLPPELKHLAHDLSGSKRRPKDIYQLLPQIFQGLDKDDFIALLELLNVDGSVNTKKAVDIMLSLGAPKSTIEQFKKLVHKYDGQLESELILYALEITDRWVSALNWSLLSTAQATSWIFGVERMQNLPYIVKSAARDPCLRNEF